MAPRTPCLRPPPPPAGGALRLFVAIELPPAARDAVAATLAELRRPLGERALRWVRPEALHVTLAFLGATDQSRVPAIVAALSVAARDIAPFPLAVLGVGSFGGRTRLRVVWLGLGGDDGALAGLAAGVAAALEPLGYAREARPFAPHITLARARDGAAPEELARAHDALAAHAAAAAPPFRVERVSLMQSVLGPGGASYRQLGTAPLLGVTAGA